MLLSHIELNHIESAKEKKLRSMKLGEKSTQAHISLGNMLRQASHDDLVVWFITIALAISAIAFIALII